MNVIISGDMVGGALDVFNEKGIEVITGIKGNSKTVAELYLQGAKKLTGSIFHEHQHHGECGD